MARGHAQYAPQWQAGVACTLLAVMLSGCAHTPEWAPWHKPEPAPVAEQQPQPLPQPAEEPHHHKPARPTPHKADAPAPAETRQVAMVNPNALVGMRPAAVTGLLGSPAGTTKDELSLIWTYAADGCVLKVYFYPDLKTADFHVLKFTLADGDGQPLDEEAPCRRKLLAMKANDTG